MNPWGNGNDNVRPSQIEAKHSQSGFVFSFVSGRGAPWRSRFLMRFLVFSGGTSPYPTARQRANLHAEREYPSAEDGQSGRLSLQVFLDISAKACYD